MTMINCTTDYQMFYRGNGNRPLDVGQHGKLQVSMQQYGFLQCFPIVCSRDADGSLVVKDGQHRLAFAELLGLPVYWVEESVPFDVAMVNNGQRPWKLRDYAEFFASHGNQDYRQAINFASAYDIPLSAAFAMLAGKMSFRQVRDAFQSGEFAIGDRRWAHRVAGTHLRMTTLSSALNSVRFLEACMAACRVPEFDEERLLRNAKQCRERLVPYSTRNAYLDMLEDIYNFRRSSLLGLRVAAIQAMRQHVADAA
jgi:hypothetical protein